MDTAAHSSSVSGKPKTFFLLDDQENLRRGVGHLINSAPDINVIGDAGTAAQALARIPALTPQVAVLDARLPDGSGINVCRDIRSAMPEVRCLILTGCGDNGRSSC